MPRIAYVNGRYTRHAEAGVHVEDRGYQFADGVYEVCLAVNGVFWDEEGHLARLDRSLDALSIDKPMSGRALRQVMSVVLRKNRLKDALLYMQVTRGVAPRNHPFPEKATEPSLVITAKRFDFEKSEGLAKKGVSVVTVPDIRWGRVDIKSVSLLPNVLAKETARQAGAQEAWLVKSDEITEGASSNAWIVTKEGEIVTHPLGNQILGGITRQGVMECAAALQMKVVERAFTVKEALAASEAFLTSATTLVTPIIRIDGIDVGDGKPGKVAKRLRDAYIERCLAASASAPDENGLL
jgi:D-alanine transaminase